MRNTRKIAGLHLTPREANLSYLMMVRGMIAVDRAGTLKCLGLSEESAEALLNLSAAELLQMAPTEQRP